MVPKNRGFEEIVMARLQALGAEHCFNDKDSLADRFMAYVIEGSLLAAYLPASQELLVVRENLDDSNLDGLRLVLAARAGAPRPACQPSQAF